MKFARELVDLHGDLISNKYGAPAEPVVLPPALDSFLAMPDDHENQWPQANLVAVYNYLRGSKHLRIPPDWEPHIPKRI